MRALARTHAADDLAFALVLRLSLDRRDTLAGGILDLWRPDAFEIVDTAFLAAALVARLHADRRADVADRILILLKRAGLGRTDGTIESIMLLRPTEALGSSTLRATLESRLRADGRGALADQLTALFVSEGSSRERSAREPYGTESPALRSLAEAHDAETLAFALI